MPWTIPIHRLPTLHPALSPCCIHSHAIIPSQAFRARHFACVYVAARSNAKLAPEPSYPRNYATC